MMLATGANIGHLPVAPGTFGTLWGLPFILMMLWVPESYKIIYCAGLILAAVWIADQAAALMDEKDPSCVIIDEVAGFTIAMTTVPITFTTLLTGFLVFRIFDIVKPFPVNWFDSNLKGGAGIVLDDIVAGIYSALVLGILNSFNLF